MVPNTHFGDMSFEGCFLCAVVSASYREVFHKLTYVCRLCPVWREISAHPFVQPRIQSSIDNGAMQTVCIDGCFRIEITVVIAKMIILFARLNELRGNGCAVIDDEFQFVAYLL